MKSNEAAVVRLNKYFFNRDASLTDDHIAIYTLRADEDYEFRAVFNISEHMHLMLNTVISLATALEIAGEYVVFVFTNEPDIPSVWDSEEGLI